MSIKEFVLAVVGSVGLGVLLTVTVVMSLAGALP